MSACTYSRTVHFQDTDSAGVVFFAQILAFCHEAYEASLAAAEIDLPQFFSDRDGVIMPIISTQAKFYQPIYCGDRLSIPFTLEQHGDSRFSLHYQIYKDSTPERALAHVSTSHICLNAQTRSPIAFPPAIQAWLTRI